MTPRVSIVVPTRNRAEELVGALDSVRAQSADAWECIVVDDGSGDATGDVVARAVAGDARFRGLRREPGGSIAAARNLGLGAAIGEFVAFLDDDDRWLPEKLARQVEILDAQPDAAFVCGRVERFGDSGGIWPERPVPVRPTLRALLASNFVPVSTVLARRTAVEQSGGFDESLRVAEDYDLWIRVAIRSPFLAESDVVARYRFDRPRFELQRALQIDALESIVTRLSASGAVPAFWLRPARRRIHRFRARHAGARRVRIIERLRSFL